MDPKAKEEARHEEVELEHRMQRLELAEKKFSVEQRELDVNLHNTKSNSKAGSSAITSNVEYAEDMVNSFEVLSAFGSDKSSGFFENVQTVVSYVNPYTFLDSFTNKSYNEEKDVWTNIPKFGDDIFLELADVQSKENSFLSSERVYYQAQLHLRLYYSLIQKTSTADFDNIYARAKASPCWKFVDNSRITTIGEYAILELAIDCVMLLHLSPHLAKHRAGNKLETEVDDNPLTRAFEMIYTRLLRHLCAFMEAYINLIGINAGVMMTLNNARYLLTRSYTRHQGRSGGMRIKSGDSPPLGHSALQSTDSQTIRLLHEELRAAKGVEKEASELTRIRYLQRIHMKDYYSNLFLYIKDGLDKEAGLSVELGKLLYLLEPKAFQVEKVYPRTHKRAALAIDLTHCMVNKVCEQLFPPKDDDEIEKPGELLYMLWKDVIRNQHLYFRYFGSNLVDEEAGV